MTVTVFGCLILRFLRFYFFVFSLVLVSIENIYQTFDPMSKHLEVCRGLSSYFSTLFSVFAENVIKNGLSCLIYYLKSLFFSFSMNGLTVDQCTYLSSLE